MATDEDRGENLPNDCNTDTQMNVYNEDDSNFNSNSMQIAQTTSTALLTSIVDQLTALNLPADVLNSLESVAAGIVAALADGPLPLGDFLLLASTSGLAIAVANDTILFSAPEIRTGSRGRFHSVLVVRCGTDL